MLSDFTRDPLTGFANLIRAVDRPTELLQQGEGVLIAFHLEGLAEIYAKHVKSVGDQLIQGLSLVMRKAADARRLTGRFFRLSGEDFLVSVGGVADADAAFYIRDVERDFAALSTSSALPRAELRHARVSFPAEAPSLAAAFVRLYRNLDQGPSPDGLEWAEVLVSKLFQNLAETLELLRYVQGKALTDDISGLANHRAAEALMLQLAAEYESGGTPFAVLFVDGDNLRQYNELGYEEGNELIRRLGAAVQGATRAGDRVFRWLSGDEFLVILPGIDRDQAQKIAERVRASVAHTSESWPIPITVSVGVAACPADGKSVDELIYRAAEANAEAKQMGKNRVS